MLYFDTTTPPAMPAAPATAAPFDGAQGRPALRPGSGQAAGDAPKSAAAAFGDLLTLLSGAPADRAAKKGAHAGATRATQDAPALPFAFGAVPSASIKPDANDKTKTKAAAGIDAPQTDDADTHAVDEKALADNLTWLLAMASAPIKTDPAVPVPTTFAGDASGATEKDATACTGQATTGSSTLPTAAVPANQDPVSAAAPAAADLPGLQPRAAQAAARSATPGATGAVADKAPAGTAKGAPVQNAAINAVPSTPAVDAQQAQASARQIGANAAPAAGQSKASADAPATAPIFVPVPGAQSQQSDSGSARRDSRGSAYEERHIDPAAAKLSAAAPTSQLFQVPVDVRAQATTVVNAGSDVTAASRAEIPAEADVPRQIVQAIRMQWADGVGDARIKLQPEYLGELSIAIRVEHGAVTASLESNSPAVREWIDNNQPMLRQALAEHGLHLDKLTVTEETAQPDWAGNEDPKQKQQEEQARQAQRARRQNDNDAPVFEMVA